VDSDTAEIITDYFALACMKPSTDLNPKRSQFLNDRPSAPHPAGWTVKGGKKAVPSSFYFMASKPRKIAPDRRMMAVEKVSPAFISKCSSFLR
jgi:hypothetical protein